MRTIALVVGAADDVSQAVCAGLRTRSDVVRHVAWDDGPVEEAVRAARGLAGRFEAVVVITGPPAPGRASEVEPDAWMACVERSLLGTYLVARETAADLVETGGAFVAVTSTAGLRGVEANSAYSAAAHGVIGLMKSLALEHAGDGARYNTVCVGQVDGTASVGLEEVSTDRIPVGRLASPLDVAHLAAHMVSRRSSYSTGSVAVLDGGLTAGLSK